MEISKAPSESSPVGQADLNKLRGFRGNLADLAVVQPVNFAFQQRAAEEFFVVIAEGEGPSKSSVRSVP